LPGLDGSALQYGSDNLLMPSVDAVKISQGNCGWS
jgi:hypothetical protein